MSLQPNLLLLGCLGASLLPLSAGRAAPGTAPVSSTESSLPHPDTHSSSASPRAGGNPSSAAPQSPPAPSAPQSPPSARTLPDYGGRDGITGAASASQSSPALNPLAQAWRAFEALAIVLALVVGGLYGLKRSGMLKSDGSVSGPMPLLAAVPGFLKTINPAKSPVPAPNPAEASPSPWVTMIGSQSLPNTQGASLHLVSVGGKTLLLGATAQSVSLITEVDSARQDEYVPAMDTGQMPSSFDGFLIQADQSPLRQSNETELLMSATTMRLQAMIARSEAESSGHRA